MQRECAAALIQEEVAAGLARDQDVELAVSGDVGDDRAG
jgi:hypothetical protein